MSNLTEIRQDIEETNVQYEYIGKLKELVREKGFDYIKKNFQYTIIENFNAKVDDHYVLERESYWKEVLRSREFGYNKN